MLTTGNKAEPLKFVNLEIQEEKESVYKNKEKIYLATCE